MRRALAVWVSIGACLALSGAACGSDLDEKSFGGGGPGGGSATVSNGESTGNSTSMSSSGTGVEPCILDDSSLGNCVLQ